MERAGTTSQNQTMSIIYPRIALVVLLSLALFMPSLFQPLLSHLYSFLYHSPLYRFSGFETLETVLCYGIIEPLYTYKFARSPHLRIDMRGGAAATTAGRETSNKDKKCKPTKTLPKMRRPSQRLGELVIYVLPLLIMDFTMVKKFAGVPVSEIRRSGGYPDHHHHSHALTTNTSHLDVALSNSNSNTKPISPSFLLPTLHNFSPSSPLQLHRALPPHPPTSRHLVLELLLALLIYDTLFFLFHLALHRLPPLARLHRPHHTHAEIHPQVTNRLSIPERLALVLLANFSLNVVGSHVLTRTVFVPVFVALLVDVHSGLDLPWGYDKVLPWGMGAGSRVHAAHHRTGDGGLQPFFCWWDAGLEWVERTSGRRKRSTTSSTTGDKS